MLRNALIPLIILLVLVPQTTYGAVSGSDRAALLMQIEVLTEEVARLQTLLADIQESAGFRSNTRDTRYSVVNGELVRGTNSPIDDTHQSLFGLLKEVVGYGAVATRISEFRVGFVHDATLDDYIEGSVSFVPEDQSWLLKIKRDGSKPLGRTERELFKELFMHEYAHILAHEEWEFSDEFAERFWGTDSYNESERVNRVFERDGYGALDRLHRGNATEFISAYSMLSPDEDIAETFVAFVERAYPNGVTLLDSKIKFFYTNPVMVAERTALRDNLGL